MTGETTSLPARETFRGEWTAVLGFLRAPSLPGRPQRSVTAGISAVLRILALDLAAMSVLLLIAGVVMLIGVELPETALAGVEIDLPIIIMVVVAAPILEELAFRGWLSGKPGHVLPLLILLFAGITAAVMAESTTGAEATRSVGLALFGAASLSALIIFALRKHPPMSWFRAIFPVFFWLSTAAFACIHLLNFEEAGASLLPLVLPQFILGMLLGYLRVNYGLWSSMLLHALHNGLIIGVVLLATTSSS